VEAAVGLQSRGEGEAASGMQSLETSPSLPAGFQRSETNPRTKSSKDTLAYIPLGEQLLERDFIFKTFIPTGGGDWRRNTQEKLDEEGGI
jgi:hypothetical protein